MDYNLLGKNDSDKRKYEEFIAQEEEKWTKLSEEIKQLRTSKEGTFQERSMAILEKQIQMEEIDRGIVAREQAIEDLYVREMQNTLMEKKQNNEISVQEFANEIKNIREYRSMISTKNFIEDYDREDTILDMKLKLEYMKKSLGKVPKEQADKNIATMRKEKEDNAEFRQDEENDLIDQKFKYDRRNLYYQRNVGEITNEELKQKESELEQKKGKVPLDKDFKQIFGEMATRYLQERGKEQSNRPYERETSKRLDFSVSALLEKKDKEDMNEEHKYAIAHYVPGLDNKINDYIFHTPGGMDALEYAGKQLGEEYAKGLDDERADLARQFAMLEVQGLKGDFENPYDWGVETSGYDNPKMLLQFEKVNGLNIEEIEETIGLDTTTLHQDVFVATYEIEDYDLDLKENVMKPIKEYYRKNENGEFELIGGTSDRGYTKLTIDGFDFTVESSQIMQGDTIESVTQKELGDKFLKSEIESSMNNGKVTEVSQITDWNFLKDFVKQTGHDDWDLSGRAFLISTLDKDGNEDFDIIFQDNADAFHSLDGINPTEKSGREMYTTTGRKLVSEQGALDELDKRSSLKEFVTKDGHRYSITRDKEGRLGFNEIFRENENVISSKHVDTYTYSTDDLVQAYGETEINDEDVKRAYETIERTKAEREQAQNKGKENNFEGR